MKKNFYMPGSELTEEEKESIKNTQEQKELTRQEDLKRQEELAQKKKSELDFMNVTFEPFEDRILVYPDPVETKTAGGLYKPEEVLNKVKPLIGTIVAVGIGKPNATYLIQSDKINKYDHPVTNGTLRDVIHPGERIFYGNYAGTEITLNEIKYLIMRFADIFGKDKPKA